MIKIVYSRNEDRKICEDTRYASMKIGDRPAKRLAKLIVAIESSIDLSDLAGLPQFRLHQLKGNKKDVYSFSIDQQFRMEFYPMDENNELLLSKDNEREMYKKTRIIKVLRITNHYE